MMRSLVNSSTSSSSNKSLIKPPVLWDTPSLICRIKFYKKCFDIFMDDLDNHLLDRTLFVVHKVIFLDTEGTSQLPGVACLWFESPGQSKFIGHSKLSWAALNVAEESLILRHGSVRWWHSQHWLQLVPSRGLWSKQDLGEHRVHWEWTEDEVRCAW